MASAFCVVAGMTMFPIHISACSTVGYTIRCSYTSYTEYKYKVFARLISPCNSSSVFILMIFPAKAYDLHKYIMFIT